MSPQGRRYYVNTTNNDLNEMLNMVQSKKVETKQSTDSIFTIWNLLLTSELYLRDDMGETVQRSRNPQNLHPTQELTASRYPHSKRSNAFSASRNRSPPGKPVFLASAMTCKSRQTLSDANRPLRKPVWSGLINFPTTLSSRKAITLE
ncbi:hypothetical protein JOB18_038701 [Solea senegalensis]|uniref:Uncharacterized protein n=1 Tax=Solea senegalensis TaxID=28829 RepID=A0AAV6PDS1_SOLSE|nr:hypothetical protein JOB18_038701 [Solea senegalensis]